MSDFEVSSKPEISPLPSFSSPPPLQQVKKGGEQAAKVSEEDGLDIIIDALEKSRIEKRIAFEREKISNNFIPPSAAEQQRDWAAGGSTTKPLVDGSGRPRWIVSKECWCDPGSPDECKFHKRTEPGWKTCPQKNISRAPRRLWSTNPDFGKPRDFEQAVNA